MSRSLKFTIDFEPTFLGLGVVAEVRRYSPRLAVIIGPFRLSLVLA